MKIVFAGTGDFAVPSLRALVEADLPPSLVISQPDRPAGRRQVLTPPPVALHAAELGLPLAQPVRLNRKEAIARVAQEASDYLVVVSYGQLLKPGILSLPSRGSINVHGSLLPRHRGASPIQAALLAGDANTGVTIMLMDEGLDSGPILSSRSTAIGPDENAGGLHDRLAALGALALVSTLRDHWNGKIHPVAQDASRATHCGLIKKEDGEIQWNLEATEIIHRLLAYTPWPGAFTWIDHGKAPLRIVIEEAVSVGDGVGEPGTVLEARDDRWIVAAGRGAVRLIRVKPAGKQSMDAGAFLRGYRPAVGARLGAAP